MPLQITTQSRPLDSPILGQIHNSKVNDQRCGSYSNKLVAGVESFTHLTQDHLVLGRSPRELGLTCSPKHAVFSNLPGFVVPQIQPTAVPQSLGRYSPAHDERGMSKQSWSSACYPQPATGGKGDESWDRKLSQTDTRGK
jgi:hypothetical protein